MRDLTKQEAESLEHLIDLCGVQAVTEALSTICGEKSEHVAANWQDKGLARAWATAEGALGVASTKMGGL
jgi:hypothetical protein